MAKSSITALLDASGTTEKNKTMRNLFISCAPLLALLGGCFDNTDDNKQAKQTAQISLSLTALAAIENVQSLTLEFSPAHLYVDNQFVNFRVFTDAQGRNKVIYGQKDLPSHCPGDEGKEPNPRWYPGSDEPQYLYPPRPFECGFVPYSFLTVIDTLASNPVPTVFIARDFIFDGYAFRYEFQSVWFSPRGSSSNFRGAYLHLSDGRECSVRVRYVSEHQPIAPPFTLEEKNHWHINIKVDFEGTVVDPARCVDGYDIVMNVRSVSASLL